MSEQKSLIPYDQFKALQCDNAEAMLNAQMIDPGNYCTEDGQEELNEHYDSAEIILTDNRIYSAETPPDG